MCHARCRVATFPADTNAAAQDSSRSRHDSRDFHRVHGLRKASTGSALVQVLLEPLVLLDAAKACQTAPPDLTRHRAHFLTLSFYKLFGYPTGLGALVVRKDAARHLRPPFLGGGTIEHALAAAWPSTTHPRTLPAAFEAGTPHFLGLRSLPAGFAAWRRHTRDSCGEAHAYTLAAGLARDVSALRHGNGRPACTVLGWPRQCGYSAQEFSNTAEQDVQLPHLGGPWGLGIGEDVPRDADAGGAATAPARGPVVAFVVWDAQGFAVSSHSVRDTLAASRVLVRSGCCCNPGACAAVLGLSDEDVLRNVQEGWTCGGDVGVVRGRHTGVVRASLGVMTGPEDTRALLRALQECISGFSVGGRGRDHCGVEGGAAQGVHTVGASTGCGMDHGVQSGAAVAGWENEAAGDGGWGTAGAAFDCSRPVAVESIAERRRCDGEQGGVRVDRHLQGRAGGAAAAACMACFGCDNGRQPEPHAAQPAQGPCGNAGAGGGAVWQEDCIGDLHRCTLQAAKRQPFVAALWVYPVKSVGGQEVVRWPVTSGGLLLDRAWALTDRCGRVLTCAQYPRLLLFSAAVSLSDRALRLTWRGGTARAPRGAPRSETAEDGGDEGHRAASAGGAADAIVIAWPACMRDSDGGFVDTARACCDEYAVSGWEIESGGARRHTDVNAWLSRRLGVDVFITHRCRDMDCMHEHPQGHGSWASSGRQKRACSPREPRVVDAACSHTPTPSRDSNLHACSQTRRHTVASRAILGRVAVGAVCECVHRPEPRPAARSGAAAASHIAQAQPQCSGGGCSPSGDRSFANKGALLLASSASVRCAAELLRGCRSSRPSDAAALDQPCSESPSCCSNVPSHLSCATRALHGGAEGEASLSDQAVPYGRAACSDDTEPPVCVQPGCRGAAHHVAAQDYAAVLGGDEGCISVTGAHGGGSGCRLTARDPAETWAMQRFRVNVVVDGVAARGEDSWTEVRIGSTAPQMAAVDERGACNLGQGGGNAAEDVEPSAIVLSVQGKAERCGAVNVDQGTGVKQWRSGGLLGALRRAAGGAAAVTWGVYASVARSGQELLPRTSGVSVTT